MVLISPILLIAATRLPDLVGDTFLSSYGIAILVFTSALMYMAFVSYRDPAIDGQPTTSKYPTS